ncbi:hypothetical protein PGT21_034334 [Puccinia graminis f. sp. tritici]|uniref:Uncharacterized protein n=1 Tax=Puccinia graminis f. sp. tritici TaxID=56615 RepID=A0A5B0MGQ1_PUCGR|nr:hypothetical protein PGTUg99_035779 [Puccinia graminis f. sp. tritici]KAA1091466.1 hypothetical protein PGT21_034334 [Puccinia graminis f. sp. tritici]
MLFGTISKRRHAIRLIFNVLGTVSPTKFVNLKLSECGETNRPAKRCCFLKEDFNIALGHWPSPRVSETDLENSWKTPQDDYFHSTGQATWPDFVAEGFPVPPLSPTSQRLLLQLENDLLPNSSFANPSDDSARNPQTSSSTYDRIPMCHVGSDQAPQASGAIFTTINQKNPKLDMDEGDFLSCIEPPLSQSVQEKSDDFPRGTTRKRSADEYLNPRDKPTGGIPKNISISGYVSIWLLKSHYDKFCKQIDLVIRRQPINGKRKIVPHPKLGIALYYLKEDQAAIRILNLSTGSMKKREEFFGIYYTLIRWIYVLHEEYLNSCKIQTFMHTVWQEKILDWVNDEICGYNDQSYPIVGNISLSELKWPTKDQFRESQVKFIDYFSQGDESHALATAICLLESFKAKNPINSPESSIKLQDDSNFSMSESFKMNAQLLLNLVECKEIFSSLINHQECLIGREKIPSSCLLGFETHLKSLKGSLRNVFRSVHPKLPISAYFLRDNAETKILTVLDNTHIKRMLKPLQVVSKLRKLLKAVNHLYLRSYKYFNIKEYRYEKSRNTLFEWIIGKIISSQDSTPLFGFYKSDENLAPWEGEINKDWKGFQLIQIQLIKYLSEEEDSSTLQETAVFCLTTWYQETHPHGFDQLPKNVHLNQNEFYFQL